MATIKRLDDHRDQAGAWDIMSSVTGRVAFNVGGNIGQAARVLAPNFHTVVSLEPCQESFDILLVESAPNVVCLPVAVSDHVGIVELTESANSIKTGQLTTGAALSWGETVGTREVECTTVDELARHYGLPDFVNVDVEGHEVAVLEGWTCNRPQVLIEVHRAENEYAVRELWGQPLRKLQHDPTLVPEPLRRQHFWMSNVDW